ncbi:MAG: hypothetical protein ACREOW_10020 [Thermodesulfobacteriota bacterium]
MLSSRDEGKREIAQSSLKGIRIDEDNSKSTKARTENSKFV